MRNLIIKRLIRRAAANNPVEIIKNLNDSTCIVGNAHGNSYGFVLTGAFLKSLQTKVERLKPKKGSHWEDRKNNILKAISEFGNNKYFIVKNQEQFFAADVAGTDDPNECLDIAADYHIFVDATAVASAQLAESLILRPNSQNQKRDWAA